MFLYCFLFISGVFGAKPFTDGKRGAYYWGQNSAAVGQSRLREYCNDDVDILVLSFLYVFGSGRGLEVDFANQGGGPVNSTTLPNIGEDIKYCQGRGKQILLSLGGASGAYGFSSDDDAKKVANDLRNAFGTGSSNNRVFGDAVIDGYDLDIEGGSSSGYAAFVNEIRRIEPDVLIGSAPQCLYPDAYLQPALDAASFDYVFVQFYNNWCNPGPNFNFDEWDTWARTKSQNKNVRVFLGTPGGETAASSGFQGFESLGQVVDAAKRSSAGNFGGIMMWDAAQAFATKNSAGVSYAHFAKTLL